MARKSLLSLLVILGLCAACRSVERASTAITPAEGPSPRSAATALPTGTIDPKKTLVPSDTPVGEGAELGASGLIAFALDCIGNDEICVMDLSGETVRPSPANPGWVSVLPAASQACTSFCLDNGDHCVFGTNLDHLIDAGLLFVNKRHVLKTAWDPSTSGEYARWVSRYGSVTFSLAGYQLAWAGMNEAGLMISTMSLRETRNPAPDARPPLTSAFWVQYQLDNHSSVEQVIASDSQVRIADTVDHYLVCDRRGECATIEFLDGEMLYHTGGSLSVKALTNSTYEDSLSALQDGNFWRIKVLWVDPNGPASEAGMMAGDWITAVDGKELAGERSPELLFSAIAGDQLGEDVEFTVRHPGETESSTLTVNKAAHPIDDRIVLPAEAAPEFLSLGFLPLFPDDFLSRFDTAAEWVEAFEPRSSEEAVAYAFEALEAVTRFDTVWSIVFDPAMRRIYFRTNSNPQIRHLDFDQLDFSCHTPAMLLDVQAGLSGGISDNFVKYSHEASFDHSLNFFEESERLDLPPLLLEVLLRGLESFPCEDGDAPVGADSTSQVEYVSPLLSPRVTWAGLAIFHNLWPVWATLTVLSLVYVMWRLARGEPASWGLRLVWVAVTALLGPLGLLAYLLICPKRCRAPEVADSSAEG